MAAGNVEGQITRLLESINELLVDLEQKPQRSETEQNSYVSSLYNILGALHTIQLDVDELSKAAVRFDFSPECPGNGYRSLLFIISAAITKVQEIVSSIMQRRGSIFFRNTVATEELHDYGFGVLRTLARIARLSVSVLDHAGDSLFLKMDRTDLREVILLEVESMHRESFFGTAMGFYFPPAVQTVLKTIILALTGCRVAYAREPDVAFGSTAALGGSFYMFNDRARAKHILPLAMEEDIKFVKAFWNLVDTTPARHLAKIMGPLLEVNRVITLQVSDDLLMTSSARVLSVNAATEEQLDSWVMVNDSDFRPERAVLVPPQSGLPSGQTSGHTSGSESGPASGTATHARPSRLASIRDEEDDLPPSPQPVAVLLPAVPEQAEAFVPEQAEAVPPVAAAAAAAATTNDHWVLEQMELFGTVKIRLLAYNRRVGMLINSKTQAVSGGPPSTGLIIHFHGGGFVAQSSQAHEIYLRQWAKDVDVPILSVDYSLAPETQYPTALEECMYAYRWALSNMDKLGSTGQYICITGDSAGGNLTVAVALKCVQEKIRLPTAILAFYPALNVQFTLSPARFMSVFDCLLPQGVLRACLSAYTGQPSVTFNTNDPLLCPILASDAWLQGLPPVYIAASGMDPLLDDSVEFARNLKRLGKPVYLKVFEQLPHGFLAFRGSGGPHVAEAYNLSVEWLRRILSR
eukprot:m.224390 g.224390  ORF g.224390 m.224390 type:complete len:692 (+) comp11088_c0_seq1:40-2115(+)